MCKRTTQLYLCAHVYCIQMFVSFIYACEYTCTCRYLNDSCEFLKIIIPVAICKTHFNQ